MSLNFIYSKTRKDIEWGASISEIKTEKLNPYGETVVYQIIDFLKDKEFIDEIIDRSEGFRKEQMEFKITSKGKEEVKRLKGPALVSTMNLL